MRKRNLFASVCVGELPSAAHIKSPHPVIRTRAHVIPPDYHVLKSRIQKGFAYFVPITLEIRRTLLSWDFDPQLGSDFHCHITRIGSHLFQLSLTFLSQLLSSSSFFTFGFKYSNDSFRCQVKFLFSQAFHAQ